jgi:hypothetical protein
LPKRGGYFSIDDMPPVEPCLIHLGGLSDQEFPMKFMRELKSRGFRLSVDMQSFMWQVDNRSRLIQLEEVMDFKKHLLRAWELTLKFIVPLVLMTLVMLVVSFLTLGILAPVTMAGYMVFLHAELPILNARIREFGTRGLAKPRGQSLDDLYSERLPLYKKYADLIVACGNLTHEEVSGRIIEALRSPGKP